MFLRSVLTDRVRIAGRSKYSFQFVKRAAVHAVDICRRIFLIEELCRALKEQWSHFDPKSWVILTRKVESFWPEKLSHFDPKSWVTGGNKIRLRISSNCIENISVKLTPIFSNYMLCVCKLYMGIIYIKYSCRRAYIC